MIHSFMKRVNFDKFRHYYRIDLSIVSGQCITLRADTFSISYLIQNKMLKTSRTKNKKRIREIESPYPSHLPPPPHTLPPPPPPPPRPLVCVTLKDWRGGPRRASLGFHSQIGAAQRGPWWMTNAGVIKWEMISGGKRGTDSARQNLYTWLCVDVRGCGCVRCVSGCTVCLYVAPELGTFGIFEF